MQSRTADASVLTPLAKPDCATTAEPRVSVLMPTYNQQDYVAEAIAAILAQKASPFELIIADDCSGDATWERVQESVAGYTGPHRLRLLRNERNLGINGNLNQLIGLAEGSILIAAAGDDISSPDRVRRIVQTFITEQPLLVHSGFRPLVAPGQSYDGRFDKLNFSRATDPVAIAGSTALFVGATAAWHRDLFRIFGPLPDGPLYEDLILGFRAALARRVATIDAPLVDYRIDIGASAKGPAPRSRAEWGDFRVKTLKRHAAVFAQRRIDALAFGVPETDTLVRTLDRHLMSTAIRMDAWTLGLTNFLLRHRRHPLLALRRLRSERRGARRVGDGL